MTGRILPFLALAISAGIIFAYIQPTYSGTIAETQAAIKGNAAAIAAAEAYKEKENELALKKSEIQEEDITRLEALLPDSVNNVQVILDLNALASRSGVTLSDIDVTTSSRGSGAQSDSPEVTTQGPIGSVDLTLTAIGTYQSFRTFLSGIEYSVRILDVSTLSVKGSDTGVYSYKMAIRLYWLR